ncbi:hypothetical protein AWC38_SpisGene21823 [Stylophora pistillata]|uniref:Uncharacterized protein n=1 Tax=Stylophora pistillata TaxID=50429 RepID=A0A2B4RCN0_STYPI|nr:hypothetical protein AWC38_SpisGene21823 [Stylophora pistillata]
MALHRNQGLCASWIRCGICCQEFKPNKKEPHRCYWSECRNCKEDVDLRTHQCFIQHVNPNEDKPKKKSKSILKRQRKNNLDVSEYFEPPLKVWADFEAMLHEDGTYMPILIVAETSESDEVFELNGPECTGDFLAFMDELAYGPPQENRNWDDFREVIGIFHNLKGYDAVFLQEQMVKENRRFEFLIPNGTKNLCMKVGKIVFKDSMCFLHMASASFSTAEFYDPDGISVKEKAEFEAWYAEENSKNLPFELIKELIAYCRSDVALLKAGCLKFIDEFQAIAKFDPMEKCVTIAQACNRYCRECVMAPDSIAIEPENGWEGATPNHQHVALEWLTWTERRLGTRIQHARQGGEYSTPHGSRVYTVDGYDAETRTIYEFHGCLFYGCRECFPKRNQVAFSSTVLTVEALRRQTAQKTATFQRLGYTVVEMWRCRWEKQKKADPDLRNFIQSLTFTAPLQPREAFFGGRTGATTLYHRIDPTQGEQIRYVDVTSEYPWVNKYGEYPIGHPTMYLEPADQDPYAYYGVMKVSILPPTHLFNPVLPHPALLDLLDDPLQQVQEVRILSPELVEVVAKRDDQDPEKGRAINVFIAAFTTCQARLKLYQFLEILQDRVLYYDTDSVVYKWKPGESEIALGDYLADMTNELDEGDNNVEFISAGAKNYGYLTAHGKCCVKVKGFSLNVRGMVQLNYEIMKQNILDEI